MKTNLSPTIQKILKEFGVLWNKANPGSVKYIDGKEMHEWLADKLQEVERDSDKKHQGIFDWLLGYTDFPERQEGEGLYWWRKELREKLSHLKSGEEKTK